MAGRPDLAVADIVNPDDWFDGGGQLQWVDATKDGAEEYVKGYVEYFANLGAVYLRIDFLSYYETGFDQSEGTVGVAHGRDSYINALRWINEAADGRIQVSLVMPNLFHHAEVERQYGDLMRIDNDASFGTWLLLSGLRETWQPIWSQWQNPFQGFTGFSDVSGPGQVILDGDPLTISSYAHDIDRQSAINLFVMAGAAIAIADQYDNIGSMASFYQNQEILDVRQSGLVGKPVYLNGHSYDWDQASRDSERWVGQLPDGDWVVALFNRADAATEVSQAIDFASVLGLTRPARVRDLWAHEDVRDLDQLDGFARPARFVTCQGDTVRVRPLPGRSRRFVGHRPFREHLWRARRHGLRDRSRYAGQQRYLGHRRPARGTSRLHLPGGQRNGKARQPDRDCSGSRIGNDPQRRPLGVGGIPELVEWHDVRVSLSLEGGTNFITTSIGGDVGGLNLDSVAIST